jgi:hypothetical protein
MNPYLRAVIRFRYLVLLGILPAVAASALMVYHVKASSPTTWKHRARVSYVAATELLVDGQGGPYLRTSNHVVTQKTAPAGKSSKGGTSSSTTQTTTASSTLVPDTKSLVDAANLYPLLIQSDAVAQLRERMFGKTGGTVTAQAALAHQAANRFRPSPLPLITVTATAKRPANAVRLADQTAAAFTRWLALQQAAQNVPANQRILIRELQVPTQARAIGGTSYGLPLIAALAVLLGFAGLAVVLDRLRPRPGDLRASQLPFSPPSGSPEGSELREALAEMRETLAQLRSSNGYAAAERAHFDVVRGSASDTEQ